jgi:cytoskeleton protein RodZ
VETPVPDDLPETSASPAEAAPAPVSEPDPVVAEVAAEIPAAETAPLTPVVEAAPAASLYGVGPTLRTAREKMGKSLAECSKHLRIRQPFLEALEDGRHADLPGGTYAAGFLRTYSEFLGLDGEELIRRFRQEGAGGFATRAELSFPSPVSEGRIPGGAVIFLGMILAAVAYGGWYMLSSRETKVAEMVPPLPDRLSTILNRQAALTGDAKAPGEEAKPSEDAAKIKEEVVPPAEVEEDKTAAAPPPPLVAPVEQTALSSAKPVEPVKAVEVPKSEPVKPVEAPKSEPVKAVEPPKPVEPVKVAEAPKPVEPPKAKPEPAKVAEASKPTEPPKAVEPSKPVEPAKPAEAPKPEAQKVDSVADGKVFGTEFTDSRVVLKAAGDDCWVQVREMDGSLLVSRLLRKGDSYRVPNRPGLSLMVGNAGSLDVSVDGRKGPALGAVGQVRRDIRLDPDKLLSGG